MTTKKGLICPKCEGSSFEPSGFTKVGRHSKFKCLDCGKVLVDKRCAPPPKIRVELPKAQRYIITAAQNATPVFMPFWKALLQAAQYYDAEILVIPGRYKNPTSLWTQNNIDSEWWDPAVQPYLFAGTTNLDSDLVVMGGLKIEWASTSPLNGLDTISKGASGIVGHGQRALHSVPSSAGVSRPKVMFTTGACTVPNYTDTRRGAVAEFNHVAGALIVELDKNDIHHIRQINATSSGSFIDLDSEFTPMGRKPAPRALSLTLGDLHHRFAAPEVLKATLEGPSSLVARLEPKHLVWHDVLDQYARNHHHKGDWIVSYGKWKHGLGSIQKEILDVSQFLKKHTPKNCLSIVVNSNHDKAVKRWLKEVDFREDPENLEFFLEAARSMAKSVKLGKGGIESEDPFITYAKTKTGPSVRFLGTGESFVLADVEHGLHGDQGPNGGKGTTRNLAQLGAKVTKAHSHAAEIVKGAYSVGKCTGKLEYEGGGPSSHSNAHVVLYANGKRSIIFVSEGRYCLDQPLETKREQKTKTQRNSMDRVIETLANSDLVKRIEESTEAIKKLDKVRKELKKKGIS